MKNIELDLFPQCMNDVLGPAAEAYLDGESPETMELVTDMENWVRERGVAVAVSPDDDGETFVIDLGGKRVRHLSCDSCLAFLTGMGTLIGYLKSVDVEK